MDTLSHGASHSLIAVNSISNTQQTGQVKNTVAKALVERIISAAQSGTKFKVRFSQRSVLRWTYGVTVPS